LVWTRRLHDWPRRVDVQIVQVKGGEIADGGANVELSFYPVARFLLVDCKPNAGHRFARKFLAWSVRANRHRGSHVKNAALFAAR
jgi:hypothetical protein